ncbi:MAG TPA: hypothetical protein PLD10_24595, partial [Rhodopila sp.]|nr:hypothetical protein [Rhodopila sp.]
TLEKARVFALSAFVLLAAREDNLLSSLLRRKTCIFLGEISYSVYLLHWIILQLFGWLGRNHGYPAGPLFKAPFILLTVGLVSFATYRWVERPARSWGRHLATKPGMRDIPGPYGSLRPSSETASSTAALH